MSIQEQERAKHNIEGREPSGDLTVSRKTINKIVGSITLVAVAVGGYCWGRTAPESKNVGSSTTEVVIKNEVLTPREEIERLIRVEADKLSEQIISETNRAPEAKRMSRNDSFGYVVSGEVGNDAAYMKVLAHNNATHILLSHDENKGGKSFTTRLFFPLPAEESVPYIQKLRDQGAMDEELARKFLDISNRKSENIGSIELECLVSDTATGSNEERFVVIKDVDGQVYAQEERDGVAGSVVTVEEHSQVKALSKKITSCMSQR